MQRVSIRPEQGHWQVIGRSSGCMWTVDLVSNGLIAHDVLVSPQELYSDHPMIQHSFLNLQHPESSKVPSRCAYVAIESGRQGTIVYEVNQ